jgi:2-polyprenyl-6-methoxyphenol hydroxylase-like FAD-dependent oxidoreductase
MGTESTDRQSLPHDAVDVLVVGGGVAGLATGLALGQLGVSALVIERRDGLVESSSCHGVDWSHDGAIAELGC